MTTIATRQQGIAYQMMRGAHGPKGPKPVASKRVIAAFYKRHEELVNWIEKQLPRFGDRRCSVAVGGVMAKCALYYGRDKISPLIEAISKQNFHGADDPAHVLWLWLLRAKRVNFTDSYKRAVTACRAFCEGQKIDTLRPSNVDIFDWDKTFTEIIPPTNRRRKPGEKKIEQEIAETFTELSKEAQPFLPGSGPNFTLK
jgi:hypothetical protein